MAATKFPILVRRGSVSVRIRPYDNKGSQHYLIGYSTLGRRRRESRSTLDQAKIRAEEIATSICNGKADALELTGADRDTYFHAQQLLAPLGIPLHVAIEEFVQARRLTEGASLIDAAREYSSRHSDKLKQGTIPDLVLLCLQQKRAENLSERYLVQLRSDLNRFAQSFPTFISSITVDEIRKWLQSLGVSSRTRENLRVSVRTFFSFCKKHSYLPRNLPTEAEDVGKIKVRSKDAEIFSPDQLEKLLRSASPELIPFIAIGAFAGLRSKEIQMLNWSAIQMHAGEDAYIEVKASQAKTGARRLAPYPENLQAWLEPLRTPGKVITKPEIWRDVTSLAKDLGIGWPQNVLRHSAISYRVALTGDVGRVSLESGNSPKIIHSNYLQLATKGEANRWFRICPLTPIQ